MSLLRTTGLSAKTALAAFALVVFIARADADVVTLKNGETFKGKVVQQSDTEVQVQTAPGAILTFPRAQVETIEAEHEAVPAAKSPSSSPTGAPAADLTELQKQIADLQEAVKKLQEEVAKLQELQKDVIARVDQVPEPRGDLPGGPPSKLELANMHWSRAGDNIKVEGVIRNTGESPGRWVRVIATVKDLMGVLIGQAETTPNVATPGVAVHDVGWVVPGKDLAISIFIPFGGWSKDTTFSSTSDVKKAPRRLPRPNDIVVEWTLEVPPKINASEKQKAGQQAGGTAGTPGPAAAEKPK